jgi:hypothetical protein
VLKHTVATLTVTVNLTVLVSLVAHLTAFVNINITYTFHLVLSALVEQRLHIKQKTIMVPKAGQVWDYLKQYQRSMQQEKIQHKVDSIMPVGQVTEHVDVTKHKVVHRLCLWA